MSDIEVVIRHSRRIEGILEKQFGAIGKGLHEKLSSIETQFPKDIVKTTRWIATMRNSVVHEDGFEIDNLASFVEACERVIRYLEEHAGKQKIWDNGEQYYQVPVTSNQPPNTVFFILDKFLVQYIIRFFSTFNAEKYIFFLVFFIMACLSFKALFLEHVHESISAKDDSPLVIHQLEKSDSHEVANSQKIFKQGELLTQAEQSNVELNNAKAEIGQIWQYMQQNTKITLGDPQIRHNTINDTYDLLIPVQWDIKPEPILKVLNKYFWNFSQQTINTEMVDFRDHMGFRKGFGLVIDQYSNRDEKQKKAYSFDLYKLLVAKQVKIVVSADKYSGEITIATGRKCYVTCDALGDSKYFIHLSNKSAKDVLILETYEGEQNPLLIAGVSSEALKQMTSLKAVVKVQ